MRRPVAGPGWHSALARPQSTEGITQGTTTGILICSSPALALPSPAAAGRMIWRPTTQCPVEAAGDGSAAAAAAGPAAAEARQQRKHVSSGSTSAVEAWYHLGIHLARAVLVAVHPQEEDVAAALQTGVSMSA